MSARMQLPLCQQRHSNVAVVRLTRCGVKLEIACYKNKVQSYRAGLETRLDEVLQIDRVFNNVSRGHYASMQDIKKALGEDLDEKAALKYILDNGDLQVAQQERSSELDDMMKDIATIISQKCVHNVTKRPFPSSVIEQALRNIGAVVKGDQPAKKQALQLVHQLIDSKIIPIERAMMKLRVNVANEECMLKMREWCAANGGELCTSSSSGLSGDVPVASDVAVVGEDVAPAAAAPSAAAASVTSLSLLFLLAPPLFRNADAFVKGLGVNNTLNVVETSVAETGEGAAADLEAVLSHGAEVELNAHPAHVVVSSAAAESLRTKPTNKPSQKASKSKKDKANKNDDDSDSEAENVAAALASLRRKSDDDDDSDDGKKKKKKAKKAAAPANKPAAKAPPPKPAVTNGSDSDEDVQSQRKKRKNQPQQQQQHQQPVDDDDNFDYGEDE